MNAGRKQVWESKFWKMTQGIWVLIASLPSRTLSLVGNDKTGMVLLRRLPNNSMYTSFSSTMKDMHLIDKEISLSFPNCMNSRKVK